MGSSVRKDTDTYLRDLIRELQAQVKSLEENALTGGVIVAENLTLGEPVKKPRGIGDAAIAGDIFTQPWRSYWQSTITGWSSYTANSVHVKEVGKLIFVKYWIEGTSNQTYARFTLPYKQEAGIKLDVWSRITDDGATQSGLIELDADSNLVNGYPEPWGGTFTASGTKMIQGQFWYERA